jgi:hypothetical protein
MSANMLRSRSLVVGFLFCVCLCLLAAPSYAQFGSGALTGTVSDPSGAAVVGADLTLTNAATGFQAKFTSNDRGEYTFRDLTPGTYSLSVSKQGFVSYTQKDIQVSINQSARADAVLKIGAQNETISVEGNNSLINFDNGTVQGGADPQTINQLPLVVEGKPRSSAALAVLLPGVTTGSSSEAFQARINGGLESGDEALLDGATMQEGFMSQSGMVSIQQDFQMSPDMVQEVKVLTSSYDPQYGSSTGGEVTMVTKSGTNQFHGAAFEYSRNAALNANSWNNDFNGLPKPPDNEHNFGANIGGPVKIPGLNTGKRKTFFYFNWEAYHQAGGSSVSTLSVPTLQERLGNFNDWKDSSGNVIPVYVPGVTTSACQAALPAGVGPGQQFPGNIIPSGCISPIAAAYLGQLPAPNAGAATTNNYNLPRPVPDNLTGSSNVYMLRVDHYMGDKDHFYFFWWRQFAGFLTQTALPRSIAYESPAHPENAPISRFNWEHTFSPTMTNHVTLGYLNRNEGYSSENLAYIGKLPQVPGAAGSNALPAFQFNGCSGACSGGFASLSNSNGPGGTNITVRPTWALNDVASKVIGHHTVTFGGEWRNVQGNVHATGNQSGTYNFNADTTSLSGTNSGSPVAGFLLGAVSTGSVDRRTVSSWYPRQAVYALHIGDNWRVTPKLTLNYGLRWDYYTPSREKYNHYSFIDLTGSNPDAGGLPGRLAFAGSGYGPSSYGAPFPERPWKKGFAPRLGFAYSWDQKTVVRAGYGIFFAQQFYPGWGGGMSLDGLNLHQSFATTPAASGATNPAFYLDSGVPLPAQLPPIISSGYDNGKLPLQANGNGSGYRPVDGNRRPYASQWNLTIERQLPYEVFASAAYVGSKGTRLPSSLDPANVLNPFAGNIQTLETPSLTASGQPKLNDVFQVGNTSLDGVNIPYSGWVEQLSSATSACAPTVAQALLPYPQFCGNLQGLDENHGNSIYNSFQLKLEKRYSKGVYMIVSYTNSKLISDASDNTQQNAELGTQQGVLSPFQQRLARTLSSDDVPQIVSAAFVWDLPFGRGQRFQSGSGIVNTVIGGWQFSPIIHYSRGTPMWFRSGTCQVVPQFRQKCLVGTVPGLDPFLQDPTTYNPAKGPLLNVAAFEPLANFQYTDTTAVGGPGQYGYTGDGPRISNLRGPNVKNLDFSLTKNTKITERVNFQLRFGFFNAFNMHQFTLNNANNVNNQGSNFAFVNDVSAPNFGAWNGGVSSPRTIQVAGRIEF